MSEIDTSNWGEFQIGDLFPVIERAKRRTINDYSTGDVPYVTNSTVNNGVSGHLQPKGAGDIEAGRCITVASVEGWAFWQEEDFLANSSGNGLLMLRSDELNEMRALFVCAAITSALEAGFAVMLTLNVVANTKIRLPITLDGKPDWLWMEKTMRELVAERDLALDALLGFGSSNEFLSN